VEPGINPDSTKKKKTPRLKDFNIPPSMKRILAGGEKTTTMI